MFNGKRRSKKRSNWWSTVEDAGNWLRRAGSKSDRATTLNSPADAATKADPSQLQTELSQRSGNS